MLLLFDKDQKDIYKGVYADFARAEDELSLFNDQL